MGLHGARVRLQRTRDRFHSGGLIPLEDRISEATKQPNNNPVSGETHASQGKNTIKCQSIAPYGRNNKLKILT